jgi:hypothetical protein
VVSASNRSEPPARTWARAQEARLLQRPHQDGAGRGCTSHRRAGCVSSRPPTPDEVERSADNAARDGLSAAPVTNRPRQRRGVFLGGGGGIRTPGGLPHGGFQNRCLRPLGHSSECGSQAPVLAPFTAPRQRAGSPQRRRARTTAGAGAAGARVALQPMRPEARPSAREAPRTCRAWHRNGIRAPPYGRNDVYKRPLHYVLARNLEQYALSADLRIFKALLREGGPPREQNRAITYAARRYAKNHCASQTIS